MSTVQIYERDNTPEPGLGPLWIRLMVHDEESEEDREAVELFRGLAGAIDKSSYSKTAHVLTILRLKEEQQRTIGDLPQIINGQSYEGIDEIREFIVSFIDDVNKPTMI